MPQVAPLSRVKTSRWVYDPLVTLYVVSDTHYGLQNNDDGDPDERLVVALNEMPGKVHPISGLVNEPTAVFATGDLIHEATENTVRFAQDYRLDGTGDVPWPCYLIDGNHDQAQVRSLITARHGSLSWGAKIGHVYFQALTERYISDVDNHPPGTTQINDVAASIAARPNDEPTIIVVHRSMTGGYASEWDRTSVTTITEALDTSETGVDVASTAGLVIGKAIQVDDEEMLITGINALTLTVERGYGLTVKTTHNSAAVVYATDALDALQAMADERRTLCILNGHNHATRHETWRGHRVFSPGSVTQFPQAGGPYSAIYPEALSVIRIGDSAMDVANYNFGYDATQQNPRVWNPDTWNWYETVRF